MRSARRKPSRRRGLSAPAQPARTRRLSPRRPAARSTTRAIDELRRGREAVSDIAGQLDRLLAQLRDPGPIDQEAPDRLAGAALQATRAFSALAQLRRLLP
jgi:hypothetical protein